MTATDGATMEPGLNRAENRVSAETQNWKLLGFFNYYRLVIALAAVGINFFTPDILPFGSRAPGLFQAAAVIYAALSTAGLLTIRERRFDFETHTTLLAFTDIVLLTVLMHASGGLSSGTRDVAARVGGRQQPDACAPHHDLLRLARHHRCHPRALLGLVHRRGGACHGIEPGLSPGRHARARPVRHGVSPTP